MEITDLPTPVSRIEQQLAYIIEHGSGGSADPEQIAQAVIEYIAEHPELSVVADGSITAEKLSDEIAGQIAKAHTHENKELLDEIIVLSNTEISELLKNIF